MSEYPHWDWKSRSRAGNTLTCLRGRIGFTHFGRDIGHPTDQTSFLRGWRETDWTGRPARPIGCDPREPYTPSLAAAARLVLSFSVSHLPSWLYPSHGRDWPPNPSDLGDCLGLPPRAPFPAPPFWGDVASGGSRGIESAVGAGLVSPPSDCIRRSVLPLCRLRPDVSGPPPLTPWVSAVVRQTPLGERNRGEGFFFLFFPLISFVSTVGQDALP